MLLLTLQKMSGTFGLNSLFSDLKGALYLSGPEPFTVDSIHMRDVSRAPHPVSTIADVPAPQSPQYRILHACFLSCRLSHFIANNNLKLGEFKENL